MDAQVYRSFAEHMEKLALQEAMLDGFADELAKVSGIQLLGRLGGAMRGIGGGAKSLGSALSASKPVGGLSGAWKSIATPAKAGWESGGVLKGRQALGNVATGALTAGGVGTLGATKLFGGGRQ